MGSCEKKKIEDYIVSIPDFPEKGIIFRDVTSILQDAEGLHWLLIPFRNFWRGQKWM